MNLNSLLFFKNIRINSYYLNYKPKQTILLKNSISPINVLYRLFSKSGHENEPKEIHYPLSHLRNFSIIAHVDHGKSTLADRLLEITGAIEVNSGMQVLDKLQVERERGITVKAQSVSLDYKYKEENYLLNLIDTPGHVDFSNEVSRSLIASQGVILLIDANKGVQAQTVANFELAFVKNLAVIPVLNKVDLPQANPDLVITQLKTLFDIEPDTVLKISAKYGTGVPDLLDAIVERIPPPTGSLELPLLIQVFDSWFDKYRGAIALVTIKQGKIKIGDELQSALTNQTFIVKSLQLLRPYEQPVSTLSSGQVGCIICGIRDPKGVKVGDSWFLRKNPVKINSDLIKKIRPAVYAGLYPLNQTQHTLLRSAIEKLVLNDPSVEMAIDNSPALGHGWRLGFLGLLHLEVFSQRLEQEYGALSVLTPPSVTYKVKIKGEKNIKLNGGNDILYISNPSHFPQRPIIAETAEPMTLVTIITPSTYLGGVLSLCHDYRGIQKESNDIDHERILLKLEMPLNEIILDFHDKLKSISSGYASFDYENIGYKTCALNKLSIFINSKEVEELNLIVHSSRVEKIARQLVLKLKEVIPRQMIEIPIQAKVGGHVIARENIKAFRKDVTAKLYGGDVTRRMKLLRQQKEGKKKMQSIANIQVPRDTFIKVFKR